jgi:hypothetical protein
MRVLDIKGRPETHDEVIQLCSSPNTIEVTIQYRRGMLSYMRYKKYIKIFEPE